MSQGEPLFTVLSADEIASYQAPEFLAVDPVDESEAAAQQAAYDYGHSLGMVTMGLVSANLLIEQADRHSEAMAQQNEQIREAARRDPLTGLLNRAGLKDYLVTHPEPQAILYIDGTNFKAINDKISHGRGDKLLVDTANLLTEVVREGDPVARDGGDEFVIIIENIRKSPMDVFEADVDRIVGRIAERMADFLDRPENADIKAKSYDLAVGRAIQDGTLGYNELKDLAESDMNRRKDVQHKQLGKYRND